MKAIWFVMAASAVMLFSYIFWVDDRSTTAAKKRMVQVDACSTRDMVSHRHNSLTFCVGNDGRVYLFELKE